MFSNLFRRKGNGTEVCPRPSCRSVINKDQYVREINGVAYHIFCSSEELRYDPVKRDKWGYPLQGEPPCTPPCK